MRADRIRYCIQEFHVSMCPQLVLLCRIPIEVLQASFGTVCKIMTDKLNLYEMSDSTSLLKSVSYIVITFSPILHVLHIMIAYQLPDVAPGSSGGLCLE